MFVRPVARIRLPRYQVHASRRSLFGLPGSSFTPPFMTEPETQTYHERRVLPCVGGQATPFHTCNIESYFTEAIGILKGSCTRLYRTPLTPEKGSKQLSMDAELTVGFLSFEESYTSKVICKPYDSVEAVASSGTHLFKTLTNTWKFQSALSRTSTKISGEENDHTLVILNLTYAFTNPLHASISAAFFGQVSKLMIQAFEDRCKFIYGPRGR